MTRILRHLSDIESDFDAVLVDQFGVLHDGRSAFPGTVDCIARLAERGIPVVALSNSGKRAALNAARLDTLGFPERYFRAVVTSGELAHAAIAAMLDEGRLAPGDGIAILSRDDDASAIEGHPLRRVAPGDDPRLLLIAGAEPERRGQAEAVATITPLARAGIPALCINPDRTIYTGDGGSGYGPGILAGAYRDAGGVVTMLGKPGAEMFAAGLSALGDPDPARTVMIGDSPAHDIAGARAAGCLTLLVRGGVQSGEPATTATDFIIDTLTY